MVNINRYFQELEPQNVTVQKKYDPSPLAIVLWILTSLFGVVTVDLSFSENECIFQVKIIDGLLITAATVLLIRGFKKEKLVYSWVWTWLSLISIINCHYLSLEQSKRTFLYKWESVTTMRKFIFAGGIIALAFRILLWIKIVYFIVFNTSNQEKDEAVIIALDQIETTDTED